MKNFGARSFITEAQRKILLQSPYVIAVTDKSIFYTNEFRQMLWERFCTGVPAIQVFADAGFDVEMIGKTRVNGLISTLSKRERKGFPITIDETSIRKTVDADEAGEETEPRVKLTKYKQTQSIVKKLAKSDGGKELNRLEHKVAYLSQEVEFIKKLSWRKCAGNRNDDKSCSCC